MFYDNHLKESQGIFKIEDLVNLKKKGRLKLQPGFQRSSIWPEQARFGVIDTIFRDFPIPEVFLWHKSKNGSDSYEVIDGQQRLRAIIEFVEGRGIDKKRNPKFEIKEISKGRLKIHPNLKGHTYATLTDTQQEQIDKFQINARLITSDKLEDIEDLFHRLNTNVYETNPQELRNLIHGDMQRLANELTKDFKDFLLENKITTIKKVSRQIDTDEIINEILLCAVKGEITGSNPKKKDDLYSDNAKFPRKNQVRNEIIRTKNIVEKILTPDTLSGTMFTKHTNYLALFTTLYLVITGGWLNDKGENVKFTYHSDIKKQKKLRHNLETFSTEVTNIIPDLLEDPDKKISASQDVLDFARAFNERHTTDMNIRKKKCRALFNVMQNNLQLLDIGKGPTTADRKWLWGNWKKRSADNKPMCATCNEEIKRIADMDVGHIDKFILGGPNKRTNYHPQHYSPCNRSDNQSH